MNFICFGGKFRLKYMYIDLNVDSDYVADSLFYKRKICVKFRDEMARDGDKYRVVFCSINKKDKTAFEEALHELPDKMMLLGHTDYIDWCTDLMISLHEGE